MGNFQVLKAEHFSRYLAVVLSIYKVITDYSLYNAGVLITVCLHNLLCFKLKSFIDFEINIIAFLKSDSVK